MIHKFYFDVSYITTTLPFVRIAYRNVIQLLSSDYNIKSID